MSHRMEGFGRWLMKVALNVILTLSLKSVLYGRLKKLKVGMLIRMDVSIEMDILYEDKNIFNTQFWWHLFSHHHNKSLDIYKLAN